MTAPPSRPTDARKEARDAARALRPSLRPLINALALNGILALALLGYPLYRGRVRAEEMARAYVDYAACLHAGQVRDAPGLALPEGHRERFAALYVEAPPEWPASCRDELDRIPLDPVFLLMPGAKTGEEEVRAAAIGARAALDELADARTSPRPRQIPRRLLRTLDHLAAAVSISVQETGLALPSEHLAFDLGEGPSLVTPSTIPLETASGGPLLVSATPEHVLRVVSADGRSTSIVQVHEGTVDVVHVRRPSAARGLVDDGHTTYFAWVTGDATCVHDAAHCANRLTGLARVRESGPDLVPELWLAAHPGLGLARSFALDGSALAILAREPDEGLSLRRFALPSPWPDVAAAEPITPMAAAETIPLGPARDAVVLAGAPVATAEREAVLVCGERALFVGSEAVRVPSAETSASFEATPRVPLRAPDPLEDSARCAASASGVSFAWLDRAQVLHLVADVDAPHAQRIADHVAGFAMARTGETIVLATWGDDGERSVTLRRVWHGRTLSTDVAAACWDDGEGLCGPAGIVASGNESFLYARHETDLSVLRVTGAGLAALPGLGDE